MTMNTVGSTAASNYASGYAPADSAAHASPVAAATPQADVQGTAAVLPAADAGLPAAQTSGAPQLAMPVVEVDDILENLQSLLPLFLSKGDALTQEAFVELLKSNSKIGDELAKGRIDKIREAAAKLTDAENKEFWGKVLSIAGKALLVIGAVAATVASAGTLGPVLLPLAVYTVVTSVSGLVNDTMKEMGYPNGMGFDLTLGNLVKVIAQKVFDADEETAKSSMKWTDVTVGVAMAVVSVGGMFKVGAALLKAGGTAASQAAAKMGNVANKVNATTQMAGGAATMGAAVVGMDAAKDRRDAEKARADNKVLQTMVLKSQQLAQMYYEALRDVLQRMSDGQEHLSEIINRRGQTQKGIQGNMV